MSDPAEILRRILAGDGQLLRTVFQPIVDVRSGAIAGAEALSRFDVEPYRSPDQWFADAERTGLGLALELAAVARALTASAGLPEGAYVAVNVAPSTLVSAELRELLAGRPLERVVLELTEHARVACYASLRAIVSEYRARGARLAIDDAGSGYSSFQHILELRPDIIKLDRSLTTGVDQNPVRFALATALVTFSESIGARVCAEGIETSSELVALQKLGVRYAQGYFLGRPGPLPLAQPPPGHWMASSPPACASPGLRSPKRLASLRSTRLMDSEAEEDFDRLTRLAARTLGVPVSLVSLVDDRRQFFKSRVGVGVAETPVSHSFCAHVVTQRSPLVVRDAREHPLVRDNPVIEELGVIAYAGIPIVTSDDQTLGSFCAIDVKPHAWSDADLELLSELAQIASNLIDLRRSARDLARDANLVAPLVESSHEAVAVLDAGMRLQRANARFFELIGRDREALLDHGPRQWSDEETGARVVSLFDRLLAGTAPRASDVITLVRGDGRRVLRSVSLELLRDDDSAPETFIARVVDEELVAAADAA